MAKQQDTYSKLDWIFDSDEFFDSIKRDFGSITDPRALDNQSYPLEILLIIILCAFIAGANAIVQIHEYAKEKIFLFERILGIKKVPSYSAFWWLLTRLNPKELQACFNEWIKSMPQEMKESIIAIDGKRLRGSRNLTHLVEAWESGRGLLLGQIKTENKTNEIKVIPTLIQAIDVKGAVVTIDAIGCQKAIIKQIIEQGGNYIIALKANQGRLFDEAINFFEQAREVGHKEAGCQVSISREKGHGRIEEREVVVINDLSWLKIKEEWKGLTSLIEVTNKRTVNKKIGQEKRYYISNMMMQADRAGKLIRGHWSIENSLHWVMDVIFLEDKCIVTSGHAAENMAIFRRIAHSIIKDDEHLKTGIAAKRRKAAWNDDYMLHLLSNFFQKLM